MEGNFLSRYNNRVEELTNKIKSDPVNKREYEQELSDYIARCIPYVRQYVDDTGGEVTTDNIFNCRETAGKQKKDIYVEYLVNVERKNIDRPIAVSYTHLTLPTKA